MNNRYQRLKNEFYRLGSSQYVFSVKLGIPRQAIMNFFAGRLSKAGKANCQKIRAELKELGIIKPRKIPVCLGCGRLHPTRKQIPEQSQPNTSNNNLPTE